MAQELMLGTFRVNSGKLRITDPCYETDVWCAGEIPAVNGIWNAKIVITNEGMWGDRVQRLICTHVGDGTKYYKNVKSAGLPFEVGVDSGQAGVYDAEMFALNRGGEYDDKSSFYGRVCEQTLGGSQGGVIEWGATSRSGYGDGGYSGYVRKLRNGKAIQVEIEFFEED
jgi:hypothetical protein